MGSGHLGALEAWLYHGSSSQVQAVALCCVMCLQVAGEWGVDTYGALEACAACLLELLPGMELKVRAGGGALGGQLASVHAGVRVRGGEAVGLWLMPAGGPACWRPASSGGHFKGAVGYPKHHTMHPTLQPDHYPLQPNRYSLRPDHYPLQPNRFATA